MSGMSDLLPGMLDLLLRSFYAALEVWITIDRLKRAARLVTGSDKLVEVPPDPRPLPLAAQRALAEAESRKAALD
jgi:hypothetical protein